MSILLRLTKAKRAASYSLLVLAACSRVGPATQAPTQTAAFEPSPVAPRTVPVPSGNPFADALAHARTSLAGLNEGKNADYIPVLAQVDPKLFGIVLVTVQGETFEVGDARSEFSIQSISKVFTLARNIDLHGAAEVDKRIGVNATGMPFNSIVAIELNKGTHPAMNPVVNPGAIASVALLPEAEADAKWNGLIGTYSAFAGRPLAVNQDVYKSESDTNTRNRAIATLLHAYDVIARDPAEALDLYTRQCSVSVSAHDLAVMGATLANGGKNPVTGQQVVKPETVPFVLAVMATAGLYETSGAWLYRVGAPAKSGVGGGLLAVVPGKFAIGTFSPPLDEAGNSVRGQRAIESVLRDLHIHMFASEPAHAAASARAPIAVPLPQGATP